MKRILSLVALVLFSLVSMAQDAAQPVVPLTERIFLSPERATLALGDVLTVRGNVLSTDYSDFYPYSRYVHLELIGRATDRKGRVHEDSVIVHQKVQTDDRGYFYATLPTDACAQEGRYYLRAYTRFMRNRPVETFPMTSVLLTYDARREDSLQGGTCIVSLFPEGGRLHDGMQQQLVAYVTDNYGNPVGGAQLAVVADADTLATAVTRASGYASLMLMEGALKATSGDALAPHVSIVNAGQTMCADLPEVTAAAPQICTFRTGQKLRLQVVGQHLTDAATTHLYGFQSGFGLKEFPLPSPGSALTLDMSEMPEGLFTFWLTEGTAETAPRILSERSVWVGTLQHSVGATAKGVSSGSVAIPDSAVIIRHIVGDEQHTPRAFEMLHLYNVRSDAPFPTVLYSEAERDARADLDLWLATAHFVGFDVANALAGAFDYPFAPERSLTIAGTAITPDGRPLRAGSVEILNLETMDSHISPIDAEGHYEQAVADYASGERFFIESVDTDRKNHRYGVTVEEERPATMHNWLRVADDASAHTGRLAKTVISQLAGGVDLNEAVITARSNNRPDVHTSQMEGIYIFSHETLQQPQYIDLESVLRRSGWVDIQFAETDNPAPKYVSDLAERLGGSMYKNNGTAEKMPINKVCIYRSERTKKQSLMEGGAVWMNFLLDDVLITHNFEDLLSLPVDGLESIEIVKPSLSDPRLLRNSSMNGLVIIKSRHLMKSKDIPSKGITVQPAGLTLPTMPDAPSVLRPGKGERIAVEVVTPDRQIISWEE